MPISDYKIHMEIAAIILAAGQGTRLNSALPKPLHKVGGRPMLAWLLDVTKAAAANRIITVLPEGSERIFNWLGEQESCIQDLPKGTGHAVMATRKKLADFQGVVLIMFADTPLVTAHSLVNLTALITGGADVAVLGFEATNPAGYGRLITGKNQRLKKIVEHNDATESERAIKLVNGGVMAVRCPLLFDLLDNVEPDNIKDELYLTDIIQIAIAKNLSVTYQKTVETEISGVNSRQDLAYIESILQDRLRTSAMNQGVTLQAPETVFLSADTSFGRDVVIEPHVVIGPCTVIGEGSIIKSFSHIEGSLLGAGCVIGPYARLRPGTNAGEKVKIGNFVETKNSNIGAETKANHLTYIGDTTIGIGANIGAGTITCNYDGFGKFKTLIGDKASIGSNTALVAPVTIGAGAIIGAGSTITADVPRDAIATTRSALDVRHDAATRYRSSRSNELD
ncbi:bifunctional UDP-N-acetylglucosamine diphosphorylase/glucosamine-1-phosphate N-acetyltransferase GlmU [Candidatus Puniceispirillum sp.]|nr:bifunctional UDP-N-acetylglucosamine diphosphorylase/glucosamine-1-phosphate N-acetyltransferase GlmU [Candidatus Puniceispirillum sp.]